MRDGCCPAFSVVVTSSSVAVNPQGAGESKGLRDAVGRPVGGGIRADQASHNIVRAARHGMPRDASASATAVVVAPDATISA